MSLTFHRGTKVSLISGDTRYNFTVGSASASQTFIETSQSVKTIQSRNLISNTFITEKGPASFSFNCYISGIEGILFEWLGFVHDGTKYIINPLSNLSGSKETLDVYIDAGTTIYHLPLGVIQNLSFVLERQKALLVDIQATARDLLVVSSIPVTTNTINQEPANFYNAPVVVGSRTKVASVTCEITRDVTWVNKKSLQNIGTIQKESLASLIGFSISGSITAYKTDNVNQQIADTAINIKYGDTFEIHLANCNTTDRWSLESIHKTVTDYKLLPSAGSSYIKL